MCPAAPCWPIADMATPQLCQDPQRTPDLHRARLRVEHAFGNFQRRSRTGWTLSACLEAVARTGADELWCLGDAIDGLSAGPPELTVAGVRAINDVCKVKLAGNHEAWALQDHSLPQAAAVIECWGVAAQRDGIVAVHGSPHNPLMGRLSDERYVRDALRRMPGWLCAHGHTHQAALWICHSDGTIERQRRPTSQLLGRSMRAVACPGALSGPDPSWLLVDTVRRRLTWHRIDAGRTDVGSKVQRRRSHQTAKALTQARGEVDAPIPR
jgi:diadenosine tetraphosphatase ApaH/serine/threonine PP2A family protein phosphatase